MTSSPATTDTSPTPHLLYIGGDWVQGRSGETFDSTNPANGDHVATLTRASREDVDCAVSAARDALDGPWGSTGPAQRQRTILALAELVDEHAEDLALLDSREMGSPVSRVRGMVSATVGFLEWYASLARNIRGQTIENLRASDFLSYTRREPVGVVGAITPWNTPIPITAWKLGPVLATGCTMVLKPAETTSLSALRLAELCLEAGVPPGVVNVVTGHGDVGSALVDHPGVDKIAFTGSVQTGQRIMRGAAGTLKRLTLELGGKSPNIVFADADLDAAATAAANGIFGNSGQVCVAPSRLFVQREVYDDVLAKVAEVGRSLRVGDPLDPDTDLGPVASPAQLDRVAGYIGQGIEQGASVATGGNRLSDGDLGKGNYLEPTVFMDVEDHMDIAKDEIFGPVLAVSAFDNVEEAVRRANDTRYGLAAYVWTRDVSRAHRVASAIKAGSVSINSVGNLDPAVPIGGYKMSGFGRELGTPQLDEYLETKSVWVPM